MGEFPTSERQEIDYTAKDARYTVKDDVLYAVFLGWPGEQVIIESSKRLYESEISSVKMVSIDKELEWSLTGEGLEIETPDEKPCEHAFVFKIVRGHPF